MVGAFKYTVRKDKLLLDKMYMITYMIIKCNDHKHIPAAALTACHSTKNL